MQNTLATYATRLLQLWSVNEDYSSSSSSSSSDSERTPPRTGAAAAANDLKLIDQAQEVLASDQVVLIFTLAASVLVVLAVWNLCGAMSHIGSIIKDACKIILKVLFWSAIVVLLFFFFFNAKQRMHLQNFAHETAHAWRAWDARGSLRSLWTNVNVVHYNPYASDADDESSGSGGDAPASDLR